MEDQEPESEDEQEKEDKKQALVKIFELIETFGEWLIEKRSCQDEVFNRRQEIIKGIADGTDI
jgi:hypothetical protein